MTWELFAEVDPGQVRELLAAARRRRFARNETVFHEGDLGDSLHLVDRGHFAVRVTTPAGDVATLRIIGPTEHFGDLAVLSHARRSATIVAIERAETLEIPTTVLRDFFQAHRSFEQAITRQLAHQVRVLSLALLDAMYVAVPRRLARRLLDLDTIFGGGSIPLTQDDLAGMTGTTRQTVNQLLSEWRDAGIVELGRGRLTVSDRPRLERSAR